MNRVALYARVSTRDQHIEPQLDALRSYAEARRLEVVAEYVDHGVSGAKDQRPALELMMREAKRRRSDAVAAVKLDRIARSTRHLTALAAELEAVGVDLVVTDQAIDTSTPSGRLLFNVLGAIAEFERDLICERTSAGMRAARRRGKHVGRPKVEVDRLALLQGVQSGASVSELARKLGVSRATIRRLIPEVAERVHRGDAKNAAIPGPESAG